MDFLDPRRRRSHKRRLFIGYVLMAIVVGIGTLIILYLAYGYDIDRKNGGVIQNGIVFLESKPSGAEVYLNNVRQSDRTGSRLALPAGVYTIRLELEGYRTWERTFNLDGGQIQRLVYPYMIPNELVIGDVKTYDRLPAMATQSPDRRWVVVQVPGRPFVFDIFDLSDPERAPEQISLPENIVTSPSAATIWRAVEWSTDNRHVLLQRRYEKTTEYVMFDRENPDESVNVNTSLGITPAKISLRDKHPQRLYFLDKIPGVLRSADLGSRTISGPLLPSVIDYKTYGMDIVLFVTTEGAAKGKAGFKILDKDRQYTLRSVDQSERYVLEVSRYDDDWYYVIGASDDDVAIVYENPLDALKSDNRIAPPVMALLRLTSPRFVSFSANTQFIALQNGSQLLTLDLEDERQYRFSLNRVIPVAQEIEWMDGHRFVYIVENQSYIIDFDGSNEETLVTSELVPGPFFDRDYDNVFTFETSKTDSGKKALTTTVIDDK